MNKLHVGPTGAYYCFRCGAKGSFYDLKRNLGGFEVGGAGNTPEPVQPAGRRQDDGFARGNATHHHNSNNTTNQPRSQQQQQSMDPLPLPSSALTATYSTALLDSPRSSHILKYLTNTRGLKKATLLKYGVGAANYRFPGKSGYEGKECITFPWILAADDVQMQESLRGCRVPKGEGWVTRRIKARAMENKGMQRLDPPGGGWGLFGMHTVPDDADTIVITEGEYDAMAVYQATQMPAVSLPNGCRSLPVEVLPLLERFDRIVLWMDNDGPGQEGSEMFAKKLGLGRCFLVRPTIQSSRNLNAKFSYAVDSINEELGSSPSPADDDDDEEIKLPKDANEALLMNWDLKAMIDAAAPVPHERILGFSDLRSAVLHEICNPDEYAGVPCPSLPSLTKILKGFRRGEMSVITGPTGSGKTTFLSQLSLDFAEQGLSTLWGSFEVKNTRLLQKLLHQFSREPLPVTAGQRQTAKTAEALDALADRFEGLPLYFMKFHGGSDVTDIVDAMDYAVYVHDVQHIILDNLQFMLSRGEKRGFDKYDIQDAAIETFRKFATERNVHVTLVVHPRQEDEGVKLGIDSLFGSARATQEADNVLILQADGRRKYIEVKKNRYDGTLGFFPLHFKHESSRYEEEPEGTDSIPPAGSQMGSSAGGIDQSPYMKAKAAASAGAVQPRPSAIGAGMGMFGSAAGYATEAMGGEVKDDRSPYQKAKDRALKRRAGQPK